MTVNEMIERLQEAAEGGFGECEVRLAFQPSWPLQFTVAGIATPDDESRAHGEPDEEPDDAASVRLRRRRRPPRWRLPLRACLGLRRGAVRRPIPWQRITTDPPGCASATGWSSTSAATCGSSIGATAGTSSAGACSSRSPIAKKATAWSPR